jgi:hypothetical protein
MGRKGKFSSQEVGRSGAQLPLKTRNQPLKEVHSNFFMLSFNH